ncbi:hypothetical protein ABDJ41_19650 [Pedobacter sp. ASV1-7]|uniref:hypothetical protein n=1 Tax=Pedobacter sp. ASV1-7 TaxID=3145237 RepID=UPI0032E926CE
MKPAFICLYYLENTEQCILEIKRTDLPENADISEVFQWLILTKQSQQIQPLIFGSMDSSGEVQERFFEQGYLKFSNQSGTYIEKFNSAQHQLDNKTGQSLPIEINDILINYLDA